MRKDFLFLILAVLIIGGCSDKPALTDAQIALMPSPQTIALPEPSGGYTISVRSDTITSNEVVSALGGYLRPAAAKNDYGTFRQQARPIVEQYLTNKMSNIILYTEAKKSGGEQIDDKLNAAVETETRNFVARFGGNYAKAEEAFKAMGIRDWQEFKDQRKRLILIQSYFSSKMPQEKPITHKEILDYYNTVKKERYITAGRVNFQLIDIRPEELDAADANKSPRVQARELAEEIVGRIKAGEDFGELAKKYSKDPWAQSGGLWKSVQPDSLAQPYEGIAKEAAKLKIGDFAGPVEAEGHIFIVKLVERTDEVVKPFEEVQTEIRQEIEDQRRQFAVDDISRKLIKQAGIENTDEFVEFCLQKIYAKDNTAAGG